MTPNSARPDCMEVLLSSTIEGLSRTENAASLRETRAIETWSSRIEDDVTEAEEISSSMAANTNRRIEEVITDTMQMMADIGRQQRTLINADEVLV